MTILRTWRNWSLGSYPFDWYFAAEQEMKVRLLIFIITGMCVGLPTLAWSISEVIYHRKNGNRVSIFIILLLFTDFIEFFLSPYILIKLLNEIPHYMDWTCWFFGTLWWAMKHCGFLLNQLVALEGILSVKYNTSVFSSPGFKFIQILIFLCVIVCNFLYPFYDDSIYFYLVVSFIFIVSVISMIIFCGALCCADRHSHTSRKPDRHILVILIFTQLVLYLPYVITFLDFYSHIVINVLFLLMSLRLISDPLLCVLVCRQNRQKSQNPDGLV